MVSLVAQRDRKAWQRRTAGRSTRSRSAHDGAVVEFRSQGGSRTATGLTTGPGGSQWSGAAVSSTAVPAMSWSPRDERRIQPPSGSPGPKGWARVPQDIDSEVVSGQATAIPAHPAASRPGQRKHRVGAVSGPTDGV